MQKSDRYTLIRLTRVSTHIMCCGFEWANICMTSCMWLKYVKHFLTLFLLAAVDIMDLPTVWYNTERTG